jgi:hypothetical protein
VGFGGGIGVLFEAGRSALPPMVGTQPGMSEDWGCELRHGEV